MGWLSHFRWILACVAMTLAGSVVQADSLKSLQLLIPASPGGGFDQLGRAVQAAMQANKLANRIQVHNAPGAGGTIALAQMANRKGDAGTMLIAGKGMVSSAFINKASMTLSEVTPIARLTGEYGVLIVPASSKLLTLADLIAAYQASPASVSWAGGFAGGTDQLTAGMIIQAIGGELGKFNYVVFNSGGEVLAQVMGGHVTVGIGGYHEYASQIQSGKVRALAITAGERLAGIDIPTLKEQGVDVEFVNWRGLMAPPGITDAQRQALTAAVMQLAQSQQWKTTLQKNGWIDMLMTGEDFEHYIEADVKATKALVTDLGLLK